MNEVLKKQLDNASTRKDDEKTQMTQIVALIRPMLIEHFIFPQRR